MLAIVHIRCFIGYMSQNPDTRLAPPVYFDGMQVESDKVALFRRAAGNINLAAGVELYQIVVPRDQTMYEGKVPVSEGYTRIQIRGEYAFMPPEESDCGPLYRAVDDLAQPA